MLKSKMFLSIIAVFGFIHLFNCLNYSQSNNPRYFNERFIVNSMPKIAAAEMTYQAVSSNGNFGSLSDLKRADLIDSLLALGSKYGYKLNLTLTPRQETTAAKFVLTATPQIYPKTGRRSFYIDESSVLRGSEKNGDPANVSDPLIDFCTAAGISNEVCAIQNLRTLYSAELTYQATVGNGNFGNFSQLYRAGLIRQDNNFIQNGYVFICEFTDYVFGHPATLKLNTKPAYYGKSGIRSFYVDNNDGQIHGADKNGGSANADDPII